MKRIKRTPLAVILGLLIVLGLAQAFAYVLSSHSILFRLAKNGGKGTYSIEQEIQFRTAESAPVVLRERWIVGNGDLMRLSVSGPKNQHDLTQMEAVYREGRKTTVDAQGSVKTGAIPPEFIESLLHYRSTKSFQEALVRAHIVPAQAFRVARTTKLENFKYNPDPYVHLSRFGGVVTYQFGELTPPGNEHLLPGVWIEQDNFLLRRIRFASQAEVVAEDHSTFSGGLHLPRQRTITWDGGSAIIRVLSVKQIGDSAQSLLSSQSLNSGKPTHLPDLQQVKDFYTRFR